MINSIIDTTKPWRFESFPGKDKVLEIGERLYELLDENECYILRDGMVASKIIQDSRIVLPKPYVALANELGATGMVSRLFCATKTSLATHEDGIKRAGGLHFAFIDKLSLSPQRFGLIRSLYVVASVFGDRFFPFANDGDSYFFSFSLMPETYGQIFGMNFYYVNPSNKERSENWPNPEFLYENIESLLNDLGPAQEANPPGLIYSTLTNEEMKVKTQKIKEINAKMNPYGALR